MTASLREESSRKVAPTESFAAYQLVGGAGELATAVRQDFGRLAKALSVLTDRDDQAEELSSDPLLLSFQVAGSFGS